MPDQHIDVDTEPKYIKPKLRKLRALKQRALLGLFATVGHIHYALRKLRIPSGNHYHWMATDSSYSERFNAIRSKLTDEGTVPPITKPQAKLLNRRRRRPKQRAFLKAFARLVHIGRALESANVSPSAHHSWLREDPWYARQFDQIKLKVRSNPPATRVQRKRTVRRPLGVGSVQPRGSGFIVQWRQTDPDGCRRPHTEMLGNVSESEAWQYVLQKVQSDPPRKGPVRYGHVPLIESLLRPDYEQPPKEALDRTKPAGRRIRAMHTGSIHLHKNSVAITWYVQGARQYENLGSVSVEYAQKILEVRTKPYRDKLQQAKQLATRFLRSQSSTSTNTPRKTKPKGRPPMDARLRQLDHQAAISSMNLDDWLRNRDSIGYPLGAIYEKFGSWYNAGRIPESRDDLMSRRAKAKKDPLKKIDLSA